MLRPSESDKWSVLPLEAGRPKSGGFFPTCTRSGGSLILVPGTPFAGCDEERIILKNAASPHATMRILFPRTMPSSQVSD